MVEMQADRQCVLDIVQAQNARAAQAAILVDEINALCGDAKVSSSGHIILRTMLPENVSIPHELLPPKAIEYKHAIDSGQTPNGVSHEAVKRYARRYRLIPRGRERHGLLKAARFAEDREVALRTRREYHKRWMQKKQAAMRQCASRSASQPSLLEAC